MFPFARLFNFLHAARKLANRGDPIHAATKWAAMEAMHAFERRVAHPRGHHQGIFVRSACDRKTPHISFGIRLRRIEQRHIEKLAGRECPSRWLFEPEGYGAFRNFLAILQFAHEAW